MTFTEDCPTGRSQFLTCATEGTLTLDRKSFEEIHSLVGNCVEAITDLQRSEILITSVERCLMELKNLNAVSGAEVSKIVLLLECWLDTVPKNHKEMYGWLQQANANAYLALLPLPVGKDNG
jgi:hypothetical protein